jgi:hypothetical protein
VCSSDLSGSIILNINHKLNLTTLSQNIFYTSNTILNISSNYSYIYENTTFWYSINNNILTNNLLKIIDKNTSYTGGYSGNLGFTLDGGITWNEAIVDKNNGALTGTQANYITVYTYDASYAIIGGITKDSNIIYYSNNGGSTWYTLSDTNNAINYTVTCVCIYNLSETKKRFFYSGVYTTGLAPYISYVDIDDTLLNIGTTIKFTGTQVQTLYLTHFQHADTIDNYIYFVGDGIQIINAVTLDTYGMHNYGRSYSYNYIHAYDETHAIAVGQNIISITTDGLSWTDIETTTSGNLLGTLRSVYMYDAANAIAVGNTGTIMYSTNVDSLNQWQTIPQSILNSSGLGSIVVNPLYDLIGITMTDINTVVITQVVQKYDSSANSYTGKSNILYGFFPNLFNNPNNTVLDVSGNMNISGNISIINNRQLNTNQINVSGDILPINPHLYNLGSPAFPFNSLYLRNSVYLSNDTMYFIDAKNVVHRLGGHPSAI